ncbi:MAG: DNA translocase FtsK [Candidatus Omnitrophota bacterium]
MTVHTQEAVADAWREMDGDRRREILSVPLFALALISLLALLSYTPADMSAYQSWGGEQPIHNWIGKPGAWLANSIIFLFGAAGYSLPAWLLFWGIDRLRNGSNSSIRFLRIAGCLLLLIATSSFLGLASSSVNRSLSDEQLWRIGGALGYTLCKRLAQLGQAGAFIVNLSLMAVTALFCTPILFANAVRRAAETITSLGARTQLDDEDCEEDYEACEDESTSSLKRYSGNRIVLQPLREGCGIDAEPMISIEGDNWRELDSERAAALPPLEIKDSGELRIVTREEEPSAEIDLGVNLIQTPTHDDYQLPPITLLEKPENARPEVEREEIIYNSQILEQTLKDFNIAAKVVEVNYGPTITCYELEPAPGIKISRIENLVNDITRALKAISVRIVAPIPGKGTVGVEVPNRTRLDVLLRELIACEAYQKKKSKLNIGLGKTISGEPYITDLVKAPHLLVAGATGSGKSVCINTIITSILYNAAPHEVKLLLVDPKQVELALYKDIPHLLSPVVTDCRKAGAALRWAVEEMETRYRYLKKASVRNIKEYNAKRMAQQMKELPETESSTVLPGFLPYIVIIIDELADLMMVVRAEVEAAIARLAAMARAVGIHLVLATQRPSVDVLTGVIKNNFPARIAFQVSSTTDSRTILDMKGAESLMGRGDMLFSPGGANKPIRIQGAFISTEEVEEVVDFVKSQQDVEYVQEEFTPLEDESAPSGYGGDDTESTDDLYNEAVNIVLENDAASTSLLQRRLKIGYGRAARLLDLMEERGLVGPPRGSKPREVVMNNLP